MCPLGKVTYSTCICNAVTAVYYLPKIEIERLEERHLPAGSSKRTASWMGASESPKGGARVQARQPPSEACCSLSSCEGEPQLPKNSSAPSSPPAANGRSAMPSAGPQSHREAAAARSKEVLDNAPPGCNQLTRAQTAT